MDYQQVYLFQDSLLPDPHKAVPREDYVIVHAPNKATAWIHLHHPGRTEISSAELPLPKLSDALVQGALQGPHSW